MRSCRRKRRVLCRHLCLLAALACAGAAHARQVDAGAGADEQLERLGQLSIEELMRVPVTSVAGTQQTRFSTPAAIPVITADDIRRAGHSHIAEALRMIPASAASRSCADRARRGGAINGGSSLCGGFRHGEASGARFPRSANMQLVFETGR